MEIDFTWELKTTDGDWVYCTDSTMSQITALEIFERLTGGVMRETVRNLVVKADKP